LENCNYLGLIWNARFSQELRKKFIGINSIVPMAVLIYSSISQYCFYFYALNAPIIGDETRLTLQSTPCLQFCIHQWRRDRHAGHYSCSIAFQIGNFMSSRGIPWTTVLVCLEVILVHNGWHFPSLIWFLPLITMFQVVTHVLVIYSLDQNTHSRMHENSWTRDKTSPKSGLRRVHFAFCFQASIVFSQYLVQDDWVGEWHLRQWPLQSHRDIQIEEST
jgi:hypothetical protein